MPLARQPPVEAIDRLLQLAHRQIEITEITGCQLVLNIADGDLHSPLLAFSAVGAQLQRRITQATLRLGHQGLSPVAAIDFGLAAPILAGLLLGLFDQLVDLVFTEIRAALNTHTLLAAGGAIGGRHLQQTVGIDIERHLHLRDASRRRRDAGQAEAAQALVALGHLPLALKHVDLHGTLIRLRCAEHIALAHRDGAVARNQHLHHPTDRLQAKGERGDVVEHQIAQLAGEDAGLHSRTNRHHLIGVHRLAGLERNQGAHHLLHHRHAGGTAHQHHVVDVFSRQPGIAQGALHRPQQAIEQIGAEALEAAALERGFNVQRTGLTRGDERQGNRRALHTAELDLGFLRRFGEPLQRLTVAAQVDAVILLELIRQPVHDAAIPVVATELRITAGGLHIEHTLGNAQHRHIEGATAEIEHQHPLHRAAIEAVGQGSRGGFVQNPLHADARQPACIAGGLTLGVVEIGGNGDHRRLHRLTQIGAGVIDELAQDARHQLFGRVLALGGRAHHTHVALLVGPNRVGNRQAVLVQLVPLTANETFEIGEGIAGVQHQLAAGQLTHQQFGVLAEAHHRGGGTTALSTGDHLGAPTLQHRHHRIGGAQVDANDPCQLTACAPGIVAYCANANGPETDL